MIDLHPRLLDALLRIQRGLPPSDYHAIDIATQQGLVQRRLFSVPPRRLRLTVEGKRALEAYWSELARLRLPA